MPIRIVLIPEEVHRRVGHRDPLWLRSLEAPTDRVGQSFDKGFSLFSKIGRVVDLAPFVESKLQHVPRFGANYLGERANVRRDDYRPGGHCLKHRVAERILKRGKNMVVRPGHHVSDFRGR